MWGLGLPPETSETEVAERLLTNGVIARSLPGTITFCPPLVITDEELETVVSAVGASLRA